MKRVKGHRHKWSPWVRSAMDNCEFRYCVKKWLCFESQYRELPRRKRKEAKRG